MTVLHAVSFAQVSTITYVNFVYEVVVVVFVFVVVVVVVVVVSITAIVLV